ncbi:MAG: hypothetical protein VX798_02150 [Bacteroidota bacterium]|uniref:Uncharacterized protein n=1 Tax=Flagellimonas profundi TaxID=2915620 RepID=A0ABS3FFV4_9FLAO|nr:hypothetical protein [Allomuricauda profundi]MBO0342049.1 hypothetical protein [Allomuricauda profundi]MEC7769955.1 hypothetical protein [Bacteroidota bacterium]
MKSNFKADLSKEQQLTPLLDFYYQKYLKHYTFERVSYIKKQLQGIDLILKNVSTGKRFYLDEKAQLDYINESLPTFAFELLYQKNGIQKQGWLFDNSKKTHFYALVTSIFSDEAKKFTSCNITIVNREKLIQHLDKKGLSQTYLERIITENKGLNGKLNLDKLDARNEGYLFFSSNNKIEKPVNLILRLDYLQRIGVAKRLV